MTRRSLTPSSIRPPFARYAHGVVAPLGQVIVTSGQLGISVDDDVPLTTRAQADLCFAAIDAILAEATATRAHVIRLNAYVTDRSHMAEYMAARDDWLVEIPEDSLPASTLMIVSGFTRPEFTVEVEATAIVP